MATSGKPVVGQKRTRREAPRSPVARRVRSEPWAETSPVMWVRGQANPPRPVAAASAANMVNKLLWFGVR